MNISGTLTIERQRRVEHRLGGQGGILVHLLSQHGGRDQSGHQ